MYFRNWLIPNEPKEFKKSETRKILVQKQVQKVYRKKCKLILQNITKRLKILFTN